MCVPTTLRKLIALLKIEELPKFQLAHSLSFKRYSITGANVFTEFDQISCLFINGWSFHLSNLKSIHSAKWFSSNRYYLFGFDGFVIRQWWERQERRMMMGVVHSFARRNRRRLWRRRRQQWKKHISQQKRLIVR